MTSPSESFEHSRRGRRHEPFVAEVSKKPKGGLLFAAVIVLGLTLFVLGIAYGPVGLTLSDLPIVLAFTVGFSVWPALKLVAYALLKRTGGKSWHEIRTGGVKPFSGSAFLDCVILAAVCLGLVGITMLLMN